MRKVTNLFILILVASFAVSCTGLKKMKKNAGLVNYEVTPGVLEAHANEVPVTIKGTYPTKYFKKKVTLTAIPVLTYAGGETPYEKVQVVQGEKVLANNQVINYTNGGSFTYNATVPYNDGMRVSELMLKVTGEAKGKTLEFDPIKLADGVRAASQLVTNDARPMILEDNFVRIVSESQIADIKYLINRSDIRSSELRGEDVALLREYIAAVEADPDRQFKTVVVSSYASPDGAYDFNETLAGKRGATADKFIASEFDGITSVPATNFFQSRTTAEDWEGFQTEVQASSIQDKDLILRVLSMYSDPEVREREIKNMSAAYEVLKDDILPKLRRSKFTVNVDKIGRSDEEILSLARSNFNALSMEEMLYAATLTSDLNEQLSFYQKAATAHPRDVRSINNVGCVQLELGQADAALASFEKARTIESNDEVKNNIGFVHIVKGDYAKAEEAFSAMTRSSNESNYGLGIVAIVKGEYDKAVNFFGSTPSCNLALAQMLKGDVNQAKVTLDAISAPPAKASYLKAIVGARLDNRTYSLDGLRAAVAGDTKYKALAKTEVDLAKYGNDDTFKSIVQ